MNKNKNLKKIAAISMLGAAAATTNSNADLLDKVSYLGGLMAAGELIPRVLVNKSGTEWVMNQLGYPDGILNKKNDAPNN